MKMQKTSENKPQIVIYRTGDGKTSLEVNLNQETVWLMQKQIAELFSAERSVITKHLRNIFKSGELIEKSNVQKMHIPISDKAVKFYNLDVVISVGYRVNSKRATQFRIWATNVLKNHIVNGFTINKKRLQDKRYSQIKELEKAVSLLKNTLNRKQLTQGEAEGLLKIITDYTESWILLNKYDNSALDIKHPAKSKVSLAYDDAVDAIFELKLNLLKRNEASDLFGLERDKGLDSILGNIEQSFDGADVYPSIEEKASHLLYFVIKNHPFTDGNKRIASFLFLIYLSRNNYLLSKNGDRKFNNNALVALALLVAESNPKEKNVMIKLIMNLING